MSMSMDEILQKFAELETRIAALEAIAAAAEASANEPGIVGKMLGKTAKAKSK